MCIIGALPYLRGALLFAVQILGGITAAALVACMFPGALNVQTALGGGTSIVQGLFIEMMLTAELVFTIFMLAAEKHKGTFIAPVGIGLALFIAELVGVYFTGGSLNPARSFGPCVVNRDFHGYHWSESSSVWSDIYSIHMLTFDSLLGRPNVSTHQLMDVCCRAVLTYPQGSDQSSRPASTS